MANEVELIIQLPRGSSIDKHLREEPLAGVADGRVVLEHLVAGEDGKLLPPRAGEIVLTVSSPETLRREPAEIQRAIDDAPEEGGPLVVLVEGAEYLRDEELGPVLAAAGGTSRMVILRMLEGV